MKKTDKPTGIKVKNCHNQSFTFYPSDLTRYGEYIAVHESIGISNIKVTSKRLVKYSVTHLPTGGSFNYMLTKRRAHKLAKLIADNVADDVLQIKSVTKFKKSLEGRLIKDDKAFQDYKRLLWYGKEELK